MYTMTTIRLKPKTHLKLIAVKEETELKSLDEVVSFLIWEHNKLHQGKLVRLVEE